jgi:hypothetical protein
MISFSGWKTRNTGPYQINSNLTINSTSTRVIITVTSTSILDMLTGYIILFPDSSSQADGNINTYGKL